ncbi:TIGR02646 family protein [Desulfococcaceae bacterium OttesenSCG-928-F15]|nr:TIGR02646 family protein [Desulfococcaceae bacterium OttesenSCG-928-F15]
MKRVVKGHEPENLAHFRKENPEATWEEMRNDALCDGQQAYRDCRVQTIADQHGLCAYCECKIDIAIPHECRVEHIHPKSDTSTDHNWHLDWQNMLATCNGGETKGSKHTPLPQNLSCDAHKKNCVIDVTPLHMPAFPSIFSLTTQNGNIGYLEPNQTACTQASIDTQALGKTITTLNLNCNRLVREREKVILDIEKKKEELRLQGYTSDAAKPLLIERYFSVVWPEFFTTIRCCLGQTAEDYLRSVNYNG